MRAISGIIWLYVLAVFTWMYLDGPARANPKITPMVIMIVCIFSVYGFIAIWRDVKLYGWDYVLWSIRRFLGL